MSNIFDACRVGNGVIRGRGGALKKTGGGPSNMLLLADKGEFVIFLLQIHPYPRNANPAISFADTTFITHL